MAQILQWGKTPQCVGEPVPEGVRSIGYNGGLTRKILTMVGTGNGATSLLPYTNISLGSVFGGKVRPTKHI